MSDLKHRHLLYTLYAVAHVREHPFVVEYWLDKYFSDRLEKPVYHWK